MITIITIITIPRMFDLKMGTEGTRRKSSIQAKS